MLPTRCRKWIAGGGLRDFEFGSTRGRLRIWMRLISRVTQSFVHDRGAGRQEVTKVFSGRRLGICRAQARGGHGSAACRQQDVARVVW